MLRKMKNLLSFRIRALDDIVGHVDDFLFDDDVWVIRYLVIDAGGWLSARKVLISPVALQPPADADGILPVNLTREQIRHSPDINTEKPITRQEETALFDHYDWPAYWSDIDPIAASQAGMSPETYLKAMRAAEAEEEVQETIAKKKMIEEGRGDPHLRSVKEVINFYFYTADGQISHVKDFLVEDQRWIIRYLVVDAREWESEDVAEAKEALVPVQWVDRVSWGSAEVHLNLPQAALEQSPTYDPEAPIDQDYETELYDYYSSQ